MWFYCFVLSIRSVIQEQSKSDYIALIVIRSILFLNFGRLDMILLNKGGREEGEA